MIALSVEPIFENNPLPENQFRIYLLSETFAKSFDAIADAPSAVPRAPTNDLLTANTFVVSTFGGELSFVPPFNLRFDFFIFIHPKKTHAGRVPSKSSPEMQTARHKCLLTGTCTGCLTLISPTGIGKLG
jgi:hypothetical protein